MYYINQRIDGKVETIDNAKTHKDARKMLKEYNKIWHMRCYISTRCANDWRNR